MRARYNFPNRTIKLPKVGDELGLRLDVTIHLTALLAFLLDWAWFAWFALTA